MHINMLRGTNQLIYPDLTRYLDANLPNFIDERKSTKKLISKIIWLSSPHYTEEGAIAIPVRFIRDHLKSTQATFHTINSKYGLFQVGSYVKGETARAYSPNPIITDILVGFALSKKDAVLRIVDSEGDKLLRNAPEMFELDGISVPFGVKVDRVALQHFLETYEEGYALEQAYKFSRLCRTTYYQYGIVPQMYHKISCNRLVGVGVSIQRIPKVLRVALLNGRYSYDLQNAHFSIMNQNGDFPAINNYVNNTKLIRHKLSEDLDISYDNVKTILLAMVYGASSSSYEKNTIPNLIGSDKTKEWFTHPIIVELKREMKAAGQAMIDRYGEIIGKDFKQTVAHHSLKVESEMLKAVCKEYQADVLIYDGWVGGNADPRWMEGLIFEATGYRMVVEKEQFIYDY